MSLPPSVPTRAVVAALDSLLAHQHEGVESHDHFMAHLMEEIGLQEPQPKAGS